MTVTVFDEGNALVTLVKGVTQLGIDVTEQVHAEARLHESLRSSRKTAETAHEEALYRLRTVPLDEFDSARQELVQASLSLFAVAQGVDRALLDASASRLQAVVFDSVAEWEIEVVDRFNEVVDRYELNDVAVHLPDFADPGSFDVLSLTANQGRAVDAWRDAADELRPLWRLYTNMARFNGHTLGPASANDLSANLFTACVLGDPGTFGRADGAAAKMAALSAGANAPRKYGQLMPFVIPALSGYDLRLSTPDEASVIRHRIQPGV